WKTIIQYICCKDEVEEAFQIMYFIKFFLKMRIIPHQISILFRNHFRSFSLQKILAENDIEFQLFDGDENEKIKGVQLMTIHKSKGLEFDVVIILGLEQGVLPSQRENRYSELEEERRLMFVAITRARRFLVMTSTHLSAFKTVNKPSIFIEESGVKRTPKISNDGIISLGDVREDRK
ncbi:MAG: ATP-binding domain-containing protein, partial [Acholeplasmataceae bacterium]|nr:ATP-binding domain-containing protein [Acholeplasmataceae bacterium]